MSYPGMPLIGSYVLQSILGSGIAARGIQWGKRVGKGLAIVLAARSGNKWRSEQRRRRAGVGRAIRSIGSQHADRKRIDRSIEISEAGPDTGRCPERRASFPEAPGRAVTTRVPRAVQSQGYSTGASVFGIPVVTRIENSRGAPGNTTDCAPATKVDIWLYFSDHGAIRSQRRP